MTMSATATAHPAAEGRALDAGDDRHGAGIDGLEHVGHRHRVLLVALDAERHRGTHPAEVRAGAERRSVAGEHDRTQAGWRLTRQRRERRPQLAMSEASNALWTSGRARVTRATTPPGPVRSSRTEATSTWEARPHATTP